MSRGRQSSEGSLQIEENMKVMFLIMNNYSRNISPFHSSSNQHTPLANSGDYLYIVLFNLNFLSGMHFGFITDQCVKYNSSGTARNFLGSVAGEKQSTIKYSIVRLNES